MTDRRVVITGLGVVAAHGCNAGAVFDSLLRGESAVGEVTLESAVGSLKTVGATVREEPWKALASGLRATSDRISLYALTAAEAALRDARIDASAEDRSRIGVAVGTSLGGAISQESAYAEILGKGKSRLSPFTLVKVMYNGPTAQICMRYSLGGPSLTYSTTCSSSAVSIGESMRLIRHGYADVMIAGGAEALFAFVSIKAWQALQVLAPALSGNVGATCRPFSRDRNGTVLGDGAAFVILEDLDRARERGARIYAELAGYGVCNDAHHMTQPSAAEQGRAMRLALDDARMPPESIDYVNAHGTATALNDVAETRAIKETFGDHSRRLAVSSTKSMHGHLVGGSGALELVISTLALQRQWLPPTAHLDDPDPECDLDYVPHRGREAVVRAAMSNSFAVGGTAGVLVIRSV
ncbi:MAG: beta-ketoacyl-[acyl-carrier-protein] synthase family protein [Burkholderiales bacterium]|nr:beta-ketoacyl-[acyl-carrier-protein] synthase family protein [Burkholderiales bacterium]